MMRQANICRLLMAITILAVLASPGWSQNPENTVTISIKDMPLTDALQQIFDGSDLSYTLDPQLKDLRVTANIQRAPFDVALKVIAKTAGLIYSVDNGIYMISARPESEQNYQMTCPISSRSSGGSRDVQVSADCNTVVGLENRSVDELAPILSRSGKLAVTSTSNNQLVIMGNKNDVDEATALVQALDVAPKMVKPVRLTLTLMVMIEKAGKAARVIEPSVQCVGAEGSPIMLQLNKMASYTQYGFEVAKERDVKQEILNSLSSKLYADLTPKISDTGSITITGQGLMSWIVDPETLAQVTSSFNVTASVEANKQFTIASGEVDLSDGKASYEVLLTAQIEPGEVPAQAQLQEYGCYGGVGGGMSAMPGSGNPSTQCSPQRPVAEKP